MPKTLLRLLASALWVLTFVAGPSGAAVAAPQAKQLALEARCVANYDGDTITVKLQDGKTEKVRLLGVDTAEMAQGTWGIRARDFTRRLIVGKPIRLAFDVQQRDRYGRLLGYVYTRDGAFLNLELIKQGYAMLLTYAPNVAHVDAFTAAQREAREARRGIWSHEDGLVQSPHDFRHRNDSSVLRSHGDGGRSKAASRTAKASAAAGGSVSLNSHSLKYHEPGCRYFGCGNCEPTSLEQANARGGVPCKLCH